MSCSLVNDSAVRRPASFVARAGTQLSTPWRRERARSPRDDRARTRALDAARPQRASRRSARGRRSPAAGSPETFVDSENEWAMSLVQPGSSTSTAAPQTAPMQRAEPAEHDRREQREGELPAANAPGEASCSTTASRPPPSPAQAALTTNASVCTRPTCSPHSDAAISSSRTARNARPMPLCTRLFITNSTTSAPAHAIHASQRSSGKFAPSQDGGVGGLMTSPFSPPSSARVLVRERRQADRERERRAGQIGAAQARGGGADGDADERGDDDRREQRRHERPVLVADQQRHRVGAHGHQRAVAERDLPAQPGQHRQAGERGEVVGAVGELQVVVGAQHLAERRTATSAGEHDERRASARACCEAVAAVPPAALIRAAPACSRTARSGGSSAPRSASRARRA